MYSWITGLFVFINSLLFCICFRSLTMVDNNVYRKLIRDPLKEQARQWFIRRAALKGIDWERITDVYKLPSSMEDLVALKKTLENHSICYPEYFLQAFHGYDDGNMNWLAAQENEAAALTMCANYWKGICAIDSEKWVRNNVTTNVRAYISQYGASVDSILDVGCSGGISTEYISKGFPNAAKVYGLDLSPYFIAMGAFRAKNSQFDHLKYFHANAEKTLFKDGEFDMIICNFLFHEVPQDATQVILKELKRVLAPGGVLAVVDLDPEVLKSGRLFNQFKKWAFEVTEPHIYDYYDSNMSENLYAQGFSNIVKKTNDPINGIWLGQKPQFQYNDILGN